MKKIIPHFLRLTLLSLSICALLLPAHAQDKAQRIRVLCYNIHYGQGTDGVYDIARLAEVINKTQPDLVALQEMDVHVKRSGRVHQVQELAKLTGMHARFGPTQHYEGGLFGNAVLSRFPILNVVIQPLPYTESTAEKVTYPRATIAVTVEGPGGKPLRIISTHFQHNMPEDRIAEAKAVNALFTWKDQTIPTILAGDMNAKPEAEPVQILLKKWTNAIDDKATPTVPATAPKTRIDYIFYRPAKAFKLIESKVIPESIASDHRPVLAVLEISNK
ncbi:MAG: endonuclease/exonuclease/phosphatase family protein [Verrucomicrobiales bacterium]|nr:endonuclease/exonuclease/phosphatase family protein [Verrucomicrobiales bacterium]